MGSRRLSICRDFSLPFGGANLIGFELVTAADGRWREDQRLARYTALPTMVMQPLGVNREGDMDRRRSADQILKVYNTVAQKRSGAPRKRPCVWSLPIVGAVLFMAILLAAGVAAGASQFRECRVAIDIGHSLRDPGAISARGVPEYRFNRHMARLLLARLQQDPMFRGSFLVNETGEAVPLASRPAVAAARGANVFLSIHHDSVYPEQLSKWVYQGRLMDVCDLFSGHSIFFSAKNGNPEASLQLAKSIGNAMRRAGLRPTLHHAGRGNKVLVDRQLGIYAFDNLAVLKNADMPAVLFECGVIKNSQEEVKLCDPGHQQRLVEALYTALKEYWAGKSRNF